MSEPNSKPLPDFWRRDIERFWDYVDKTPGQGPNGDCWGWTGAKTDRGYGIFCSYDPLTKTQRVLRAPRAAFKIQHGEDPYPFDILHDCDWPPCVLHIKKGTHQDNMDDAVDRIRMASGNRNGSRAKPENLKRGDEHPNVVYPDAQVAEMRTIFNAEAGNGLTATALAERFHMNVGSMCKILKGQTRKEAGGPIFTGSLLVTGVAHHGAVANPEIVRALRAEYIQKGRNDRSSPSIDALGKKYGLTRGAVDAIVKRKTWKEVK